MRKIAILCVVAAAVFVAGCGSAHQSISPITPPRQQSEAQGIPGPPDVISDADTEANPLVTVTAQVAVSVPVGSTVKSISIRVNGGTATIANLSSGSPGCSGISPRVCTISASAPTAFDLFAFQTFNGAGGSGTVVASGNILQTITSTSLTVKIILAGTPASITLAFKTVRPRECDPATDIPLYPMVKDISGNVIIGSYGETVTLSDSDGSGKTKLSVLTLSNSSTAVTLAYNGHPLMTATISAAAGGVTSVTNAVLKPLQMIYVANYGGNSITVYPSTANGNVAPARTIAGPGTTIGGPQAAALDGLCNLDVADYRTNRILVFSASANGNVAPKRTIAGPNTLLNAEQGIGVDAHGNIYVANGSEILEYAAGANGNVAPIKNISGTKTTISSAMAIAVGSTGKIYAAGASQPILVFAANGNNNVAPIASITSTAGFGYLAGLALDSSGKIYVTDFTNNNIQVFAAGANGLSKPVQLISSSSFFEPKGISLSYAGDMEVTNQSYLSDLLVFAKGSNGSTNPRATIYGNKTGMNLPGGDTT